MQIYFLVLVLTILSSCGSSSGSSHFLPSTASPDAPAATPTPGPSNDPGITFDGTNLTVKANVLSNLTSGSFGATIRIDDGVELFFYSSGAISGEQQFVISKAELEQELGQVINGSDLKVRIGYSEKFPAYGIVYTGGTATLKN